MAVQTTFTGGQLAPSVRDALPEDNALRVGKVLSIVGNTVTVDVAGGPPTVGVLGSYAPFVGDTVALIRAAGTWLLFGRIGAGVSGVPATGQSRIMNGRAVCNGALLNTLAMVLIPGVSISLDVPLDGCSWSAYGVFDMSKTGAVAGIGIGSIQLDAVVQTAQALFGATAVGQRATVAQTWSGTGLTKGVHLWEGLFSGTVLNALTVNAVHTTLYVEIWR